jgi:hypothetical protein
VIDVYRCPSPDCDFQSHSIDGVASHYVQKKDGSHDEWKRKWRLKAHLDGIDVSRSDSTGSTDSDDSDDSDDLGETGDFGSPEWPEPEPEPEAEPEAETPGGSGSPGGPTCCMSPRLVGSTGEVYRLSDGSAVKLEAGEQICENCDEIHE